MSREVSVLRGALLTMPTQLDIVPYRFVVGSHEPGNYHEVGDRLAVRKCRFHLRAPSPVSLPSFVSPFPSF